MRCRVKKEESKSNGWMVCSFGVREILRKAADVLQNKLTRAQYLDEVTTKSKNWLGLQRIFCSSHGHRRADCE